MVSEETIHLYYLQRSEKVLLGIDFECRSFLKQQSWNFVVGAFNYLRHHFALSCFSSECQMAGFCKMYSSAFAFGFKKRVQIHPDFES